MQFLSTPWLAGLLGSVVLGSLAYGFFKRPEGKQTPCTPEQATAALDQLRQWGTFLIAVQGGALAVMAFVIEKLPRSKEQTQLSEWEAAAALCAGLCFGASIFVATWLLGAIPSMFLRFKEGRSFENDFFHKTLFSFRSRPPYVGPLTGLQFGWFVAGIVFFLIFLCLRFTAIEVVVS